MTEKSERFLKSEFFKSIPGENKHLAVELCIVRALIEHLCDTLTMLYRDPRHKLPCLMFLLEEGLAYGAELNKKENDGKH